MNAQPEAVPTLLQPADVRAEEQLLGAALTVNALGAVQAEVALEPEHFYRETHREIFRAMLTVLERGNPVDELTVGNVLEKDPLEDGGWRNKLSVLAANVSAPGHAMHYAEEVRQKARWRQRFDAGLVIREAAHAQDDERFAEGQAMLAEGLTHHNAMYDEDRQRDLLYALMEGQAKPEFFWPIAKLNTLQSGGMRHGNLIVLSGYTSAGKSQWADSILDQNRKHGKVCLYDNEMDPAERAARRATRLGGVNYSRLLGGEVRPDSSEHRQMLKFLNAPELGWPIVDMAGWTVEEVCHHIRQFRWDLCVVDILHNFPFKDERELSASVARLKAAAKQARCVIVLVCHVNRSGVERGKRRRPVRSDLRWSGDIENLADVVCFVFREQDPETFEDTAESFIYFDKCRGGQLGGVKARFNPERLRFELPVETQL